jgi:hypothetical protein
LTRSQTRPQRLNKKKTPQKRKALERQKKLSSSFFVSRPYLDKIRELRHLYYYNKKMRKSPLFFAFFAKRAQSVL